METQLAAKPPNDGAQPQQIQKAATLLLVRDGASGLQVFMLERPSRGAFPGLHVFTGGKVDAADETLLGTMDWQGPSTEDAATLLDTSNDPLLYWLAAVRECYEESGVLLGEQQGKPIDAHTFAELSASRMEEFGGLCARLNITLTFDALLYFAHWVTPEQAPRRFDTRFFVAALPSGQAASFAPGETVSGEWVSAEEALRRSIEIRPTDNAMSNLGTLLGKTDRLSESFQLFAQIAGEAGAHSNIAAILAEQGRTKDAQVHLHQALELAPNMPQAIALRKAISEKRWQR